MKFDTEKLRQYIPKGDGYNSEFALDLESAAAEIERLRDMVPAKTVEEFLLVTLDGTSCIIEIHEKPLYGVDGTKYESVFLTRKQYLETK